MKLIKFILIAVITVFAFISCGDFGDMNKNPNAPTSIENNPELLMTYLTKNVAREISIESWGDPSSLMAQYSAKIVFTGFDLFDWGSNSGHWNELYYFSRNCNNLSDIGHEGYQAVAMTLQGLIFHQLVDNWGDVPYQEALKGKIESNFKPAYDTGEDIYTDVLYKLDAANDMYANNTAAINGDLINDGDLSLWRKFNNSLMLRLYMRMSEKNPTAGAQGFANIYNNPGKYPILSSSNENITLEFLASQPNTWPVNTYRVGSFDEVRLSETLESVLKAYDDPRLQLWFRPTASSVDVGEPIWAGMKNGLSDGVAYNYKGGSLNLSRFSEMFFESPNAMEGILMLHSEVEFLIAEAIYRGWIGGSQQSHYENGIKSSFDYWNSRASFVNETLELPSDYLTRTWEAKTEYNSDFGIPVAYDGSLEQIIVQKWISHLMVSYEGFRDYKRTGIPSIIKAGPDAIYSEIPNRYEYPSEEQALNSANYSNAASKLAPNGDDIRSKIWWQK